jgi:adenosylcobinamide-GDP ribazoletransferase
VLRQVYIALGFLTIAGIKVEPCPDMEEVGLSGTYFPIVGAIIGIVLALSYVFLSLFFPSYIVSGLLIAIWVAITGGLHLDGWTDCCDSLPASVSPERRYKILKDPTIGTFGGLGLILLIGLKWAAIQSLASILPLLIAPIISRTLMVCVLYEADHTKQGMAADFLKGLKQTDIRKIAVLGLLPSLFLGVVGLLAVGISYLAAVWFRNTAENRLPAINGDVFGAICEFSELVFLILLTIRSPI